MKLGTVLLGILLYHLHVFVGATTQILPDQTARAVEGHNTTITAVFGPGSLPNGSVILVALRKPDKEVYMVGLGKKTHLENCHMDVNSRAGVITVHIYNVSFAAHHGEYIFGVSTPKYVPTYKQTVHLFVEQKPGDVFIRPTGIFEMVANEYRNLTCKSSHRFPGCAFSWFKIKGKFHHPLNGIVTASDENCTSTMVFRVESNDHGMKAMCELTNRNVNDSSTSSAKKKVRVKSIPRAHIVPKGTIRVLIGQSVELSCKTKGYPEVSEIQWLYKDSVIYKGNDSLQLYARPAIAGLYFCHATNSIGSSLTSTFVEVQYPPEISHLLDQEVDEGKNLTVVCMTLAVPATLMYVWERENDAQFRVFGQHLTLNNVTPEMTDRYTCVAINAIDTISHKYPAISRKSFQLNIRYPPGIPEVMPSNVTELEGREVEFTCTSNRPGHPSPDTRWINKHGQIIGNESVLTITVEKNYGNVFCQQQNELGRSAVSSPANIIALTVQDKMSKSVLGRYVEETGIIKIETIDLTFPVTAKVDVLRKNASAWEQKSLIVDSGTDIIISGPETVIDVQLLLCREVMRSCIRVPIITERWSEDTEMTEDADEEGDEWTFWTVIGTLAVTLVATIVYVALMVGIAYLLFKYPHRCPRLAESILLRRQQERGPEVEFAHEEVELEEEPQAPRPVEDEVDQPERVDDSLNFPREFLV